jgi:hypothetical protein
MRQIATLVVFLASAWTANATLAFYQGGTAGTDATALAAWQADSGSNPTCLAFGSTSTLCEPFNRGLFDAYQPFFFRNSTNGNIVAPRGVLADGTLNPMQINPSPNTVFGDHLTIAGAESTTFRWIPGGPGDLTPGLLYGLAAYFDMSPRSIPAVLPVGPGQNAPGSGLHFTLLNGAVVVAQIDPAALVDDVDNNNVFRGFFGFTSTVPFTDFVMTSGNYSYTYACASGTCIKNNDGGELFDMDNVMFATTAPAVPTPEPTTLVLIGAGLAGIGLVHRKRS